MEKVSISLSVMETKYHTKEICDVPAVDRRTEKVLGVPVRGRFGEGRAKPLRDWIRSFEAFTELLFILNRNASHNPSTDRNPKTFEVRSACPPVSRN